MFIKKFPTTAVLSVVLPTDYALINCYSANVNPIYGGRLRSMI